MAAKILFFLFAAILFFSPPAGTAEEMFRRAGGSDRIVFRNREYFNYELLLANEPPSEFPLIGVNDILLEPEAERDPVLHKELLERLYRDNRRRVFFIAELSPYFPPRRHNRLPWAGGRNQIHFGNVFWTDPGRVADVYRRVYGSAETDFNSQMRRVERHGELERNPRVFVFARLQRTGANSQWRNSFGWDDYYYFEGDEIYIPRGD